MSKESVEGIILVLSCQKHFNSRLKEFKLPKSLYSGWKVIYVIGDLFLDVNYRLENNILVIKCEDSYIHLLKKFVLSIKYLNEIYEIKQGILRSGDDLIFNESNLVTFLETSNKPNFYGCSPRGVSVIKPKLDHLKITRDDYFMIYYYLQHQEDFENPQHNLKGVDIVKYKKRPQIDVGPAGVLYYISNKSCKILVDHMEKINFNIFHFDEFSQSYPYTIEDCAVSFILYFNEIDFIHSNKLFSCGLNNSINDFQNVIAIHTNKYK
jgi:hypothetical protein